MLTPKGPVPPLFFGILGSPFDAAHLRRWQHPKAGGRLSLLTQFHPFEQPSTKRERLSTYRHTATRRHVQPGRHGPGRNATSRNRVYPSVPAAPPRSTAAPARGASRPRGNPSAVRRHRCTPARGGLPHVPTSADAPFSAAWRKQGVVKRQFPRLLPLLDA